MAHFPRKRFGQNFLNDTFVIEQIIAAINPKPDEMIIEVGPGLGALTKPLLQTTEQLHVIELDKDIIPLLSALPQNHQQLTIHQADVLKVDFASLTDNKKPLRIVGNLPYNISTPLIFHLLAQKDVIKDMHFMLQKEVVQRICAKPNTKAYGRLSIMVQYHCTTEDLFTVYPEAFSPPPKVNSAVVRLIPHTRLPYIAKDENHFSDIVREAFNHRRKTIHNALKGFISSDAFTKTQIDPKKRAEQLSISDFVNLSNAHHL